MRAPEEAIAEILRRVPAPAATEAVPLAGAAGCVLARDVASDVDLPPFEKSAMDGYAVRSADFDGGARTRLAVVGEAKAGAPWAGTLAPGQCVAIYTGAEVPASADAVVVVERSVPEGGDVWLEDRPRPGQHVCHRGEDLRSGEVVLGPGRRLTAIDLAVLAAVGCDPVPVRPRPRVAILTTGDELVPVAARPGPGQIREGNTIYLAARAARENARVENLGVVADDEGALAEALERAFAGCDLLVTTGGVSMGRYDLVGAALEAAGVEPVLHKIAIRPGKPLWFGMRGRVPVFGLPGNPVSCLVGFEVFVRPALAKLAGEEPRGWRVARRRARWRGAATRENAREQYLPVLARPAEDGVDDLEPLPWSSSADIVELARADGLAVVAAGRVVQPGELLPWQPLRSFA